MAKAKALAIDETEALFAEIVTELTEHKLGHFSLMSDGFAAEPTEWISTGITLLDAALHGGMPVGRIAEIYGKSQTGKSLLGITMLALAQKQGAVVALIDTERAYTSDFSIRMAGIDPTKLIYCEVETVEKIFDTIERTIAVVRKRVSTPPIVFLWDSVAAVCTEAELKKTMLEEQGVAYAARVIRRGFRRLTDLLADQRAILLMTNQTSTKIGIPAWADNEDTYGGGGPKFYSSVRLRMETMGKIAEKGSDPKGVWCQVTIMKNRLDPPGRKIRVPIYFSTGVNDDDALLEYLYTHNHLGESKGWISWPGKKLARREEFLRSMQEDLTLRAEVKAKALHEFLHDTVPLPEEGMVEGV